MCDPKICMWSDAVIDSFDVPFHFLSNFDYSPITVQGIQYNSVEHAYQALKTEDPIIAEEIRKAPTPGKAKRLGQEIELRSDWDNIKVEVMEHLLRAKFSTPWFQEFLRKTKPRELIEGNTWHDNFWGDCRCDQCKNVIGQNMLGKLLMQIRSEIPDPIKE